MKIPQQFFSIYIITKLQMRIFSWMKNIYRVIFSICQTIIQEHYLKVMEYPNKNENQQTKLFDRV